MEQRSASIETLLKRIEIQRWIMIQSGQHHGFTSPVTLEHSKALDHLIIHYQLLAGESKHDVTQKQTSFSD